MAKIYKVITPRSATDSAYEEHEFLLCWFGRNGAFYQKLFYDWENVKDTRVTVKNDKSATNIGSMIEGEENGVRLIAEDLSKNDLEVLFSLFGNKQVIRLYKDGTISYCAVENNGKTYKQNDGRYELEIKLVLPQNATCR